MPRLTELVVGAIAPAVSVLSEGARTLRTLGERPLPPRSPFGDRSPVGMPIAGAIQSYVSAWAETGETISPELALEAPTVASCVNQISATVARMEWAVELQTVDGPVPAPEHWLYSLLNSEPNQDMTSMTWRESMLRDAITLHNGWSFINFDRYGRPRSLEKMRPDLTYMMRDAEDVPYIEYLGCTGGPRRFRMHEVFHLIGPSFDGLLGVPPIHTGRRAIAIEIAAERFMANFFRNGARVGGFLKMPGRLSPARHAELLEEWKKYQGPQNAGKIVILEDGLDFKGNTMNFDDAQMIELRRFSRQQIATLFGVPPHRVGDTDSQGYNTTEQADSEYVKHTLSNWATRLEQEALRKLCPRTEPITTRIKFDSLLRGDMLSRYQANGLAISNAWKTPNEVRREEGLGPKPGGDQLRVPLNTAPAGDPSQLPGADPNAKGGTKLLTGATVASPKDPEVIDASDDKSKDQSADLGEENDQVDQDGERMRECVRSGMRPLIHRSIVKVVTREAKRATSKAAARGAWAPDAKMALDDLAPGVCALLRMLGGDEPAAGEQARRCAELLIARVKQEPPETLEDRAERIATELSDRTIEDAFRRTNGGQRTEIVHASSGHQAA